MAVTVINRPIGHKLGTDYIQAIIYNVAGDAVVYVAGGHTLVDGDYVYIESNFERYNGFKYVDSIAYDSFKIKNSEGGDIIEFIQEADIQFRISELEHGFQCVHLPIVYELHSDLWPINEAEEAYTPVVIDSFEDNGGYVKLNLSVGIDPTELNYIELVGSGSLAGAYQIIDVIQPWSIVINLAYDATFDFTGYQVVNYYNNYFINVYVYGGLRITHPWSSEKPYTVLAHLKFIPDSDNNNIKFSISDILKGLITTRNNLTLDTLPCNLDFFTQFFIVYSESYDVSDGSDISSLESSNISDLVNFEGCAINAMLPFKSLNSGHLSDYIADEDTQSRWLTLFDRPIAVVGYFFDLSIINQNNDVTVTVTIFKSINGIVTNTEIIEILNPGLGVLRVPITIESGYDQYCIQALFQSSGDDQTELSVDLNDFNSQVGSSTTWTLGSNPSVSLLTPSIPTKKLYSTIISVTADYQYTIQTVIDALQGLGLYDNDIKIGFLNSSLIEEISDTTNSTGTSSGFDTFIINNVLTATNNSAYLFIDITDNLGTNISFTMQSMDITIVAPEDIDLSSEQICIDIIDECGSTFTNDNLRLTEGGEFRELE